MRNPEKRQAAKRRWRANPKNRAKELAKRHTPEAKAKTKSQRQAWVAENPERARDTYRIQQLKRYGITPEEYERMLVAQNGVCAICRQPETATHKGKVIRLTVDHHHGTGKVRLLLCRKHNSGIAFFDEDPAVLRAAADYLEKNK